MKPVNVSVLMLVHSLVLHHPQWLVACNLIQSIAKDDATTLALEKTMEYGCLKPTALANSSLALTHCTSTGKAILETS